MENGQTFGVILRVSDSGQLPLLITDLDGDDAIPLRVLGVGPRLLAVELSS